MGDKPRSQHPNVVDEIAAAKDVGLESCHRFDQLAFLLEPTSDNLVPIGELMRGSGMNDLLFTGLVDGQKLPKAQKLACLLITAGLHDVIKRTHDLSMLTA